MTQPRYFSDRAELRRPTSGLLRHEVPERVRNRVANVIEVWGNPTTYRGRYDATNALWQSAVIQLDWPAGSINEYSSWNHDALRRCVETGAWHDVLDLFEVIFLFIERRGAEFSQLRDPTAFRNYLNDALIRHYSVYQMNEGGRIYEPGAQATEAVVAEARALLTDGRLSGPDRQYQDALMAFSRRPDPNYEGAVAGAVNAAEGVARIVLADLRITLGDAAKRIAREKGLHGALAEGIGKLYGYASDEAGRHGLVGDSKVDRPVAEFCLHQAAAIIVFLARLYGYDVVEGSRSEAI